MKQFGLPTAIALSFLLLAGCASFGKPAVIPEAVVEADPNAQLIGSTSAGLSFVAEARGVLGNSTQNTITVVKQYTAASGKLCKKFTTSDSPDSLRVACMESDGSWKIYRSLDRIKQASFAVLEHEFDDNEIELAQARSITSIVPIDISKPIDSPVESSSAIVLAGDTLWNFSKRETGRGENWRRIATFNNITEPYRILVGNELLIPEDLRSGN